MSLSISRDGRLLERDGAPFFYLADTAWELLHRLDREQTQSYLATRAAQGFTVVQTVILAELDGLRTPNANGDLPLHDLDPTRPNEAYFAHVDWAVQAARQHGLVLALLPTWGDKWHPKWGVGPQIFTPENARVYGEFLGRRYAKTTNVLWVLGGDRPFEAPVHRAIVEATAHGLDAGAQALGARLLKTLHPCGGQGSSQTFPDAPWLDFHMWQSGHGRNTDNWRKIAADYARVPVKPVLDGEPGYEDHKAGFALENGFLDDYDCRKSLYWALFAGACGHTYGCHAVWQMWEKGRKPVNHPRRSWSEALALPGASQMHFARELNEKFPFLGGTPAPEIVLDQNQNSDEPNADAASRARHVAAIFGAQKTHALLYFPCDDAVKIALDWLPEAGAQCHWFDPRTGVFTRGERVSPAPHALFPVPGNGPDWILILEIAP